MIARAPFVRRDTRSHRLFAHEDIAPVLRGVRRLRCDEPFPPQLRIGVRVPFALRVRLTFLRPGEEGQTGTRGIPLQTCVVSHSSDVSYERRGSIRCCRFSIPPSFPEPRGSRSSATANCGTISLPSFRDARVFVIFEKSRTTPARHVSRTFPQVPSRISEGGRSRSFQRRWNTATFR